MKIIGVAVGLISAAIIAYQLALMRILSQMQWHHFAFMIISIALLGFGTSGIVMTFLRRIITSHFHKLFFMSLILCSIWMIISPLLLQFVTFEPYLLIWDARQLFPLLIMCVVIFLPFYFGATAIGLSFMHYGNQIHTLYFSNLVGSACGGLLGILLMFFFRPSEIIPLLSLLPFAAAAIYFISISSTQIKLSNITRNIPLTFIGLLVGNFLLIGATLLYIPIKIRLSEYKSLQKTLLLPDAQIINEKISPLGIINVVKSSLLRYAPGMSLAYKNEIPSQLGVFVDGEWAGSIINQKSLVDTNGHHAQVEFLNSSTSALPYRLVKNPQVLIIGSGTGNEVQLAYQQGANTITGIEINEQLIELITSDYAEETQHLYTRPNVKIVHDEARSFLTKGDKRYDIITLPIMEGFSTSAAGVHSIFENYLFTSEAFTLMFDRLTDDGMLVITAWMNHPPRHTMKLMALLFDALKRNGITHPEFHFAGIRSWSAVTFIVKRSEFTNDEIQTINDFCNTYSFDLIHHSTISSEDTNRFNKLEPDWFATALRQFIVGTQDSLYHLYPFNTEPPTDNQPYFSHFLKSGSLRNFFELFGSGYVTLMDMGFIILLATLIAVVLFSSMVILLPLIFTYRKEISPRSKWWTICYFGALGFGYMFIEIVFIQKFILFLGHPIYSVSAVITGMLFFSGLGSMYSSKLNLQMHLKKIIACILLIGVAYYFLLPEIFQHLITLPNSMKYGLAMIIIAPISFCMGMPFPHGLTTLSKNIPQLVPWAWGINGYTSVIGTVMATFLAMEVGFHLILLLAMLSYSVVLVMGSRFAHSAANQI